MVDPEPSPFGDSPMAAPQDAFAQQRRMAIRFTASGSEYFRIWIVNLLLTVLTLSLYYPWAKVRPHPVRGRHRAARDAATV